MRNRTGRSGEHLAALLLKRKGFYVLCRNYTCKLGEIDLVVKKGGLLVFCEVKTRHDLIYGRPFEAVTAQKQKKIKQLAEAFLKQRKVDFQLIRFDVVSILLLGNKPQIEHIENAFY